MGFSKDNQSKSEYAPLTGPVCVKLLACCPTLEEAKGLGINLNKEPKYFGVDNETGANTARLDFYLSAEVIDRNGTLLQNVITGKDDKVETYTFKVAIFLQDEPCVASGAGKLPAGTLQYIDGHGKTAFIEDGKATPDWIDDATKVPAKKGEAGLYEFLIAATKANTSSQAPMIRLETDISDIIAGDVEELRSIVSIFSDEEFYVLLGVNDDGYQEVFRGAYAKTKMGVKVLTTKASDKGYPWKCAYTPKLQYYNPEVETKKADVDVDYV